jgi:hypothetical protein
MSDNMCSIETNYICIATKNTECKYKESSEYVWCIHGKACYDVNYCMSDKARKEALKELKER